MKGIMQGSKCSKFLPMLFVLFAALALALAGCSGSAGTNGTNGANGVDGATGSQGPQGLSGPTGSTGPAGPQGPHGSFANSSSCIDCHHMSAMAISMGIPIRPHENGGKPLVAGVTQNNVASFVTASAGVPVSLATKTFFTWIEESTGATHTVNVTGAYWQYMDGLPSTITGAVTSPTITVTIPTGLDYRQQLVNLALLPGTSWDTNRYRPVPINDTNLTLGTMTRYLLTVFGDDGKVYWDLIGVKANEAVNDFKKYAKTHTTGEGAVPINIPVLLTAQTSSMTTPMSWNLTVPGGSSAALSAATDTYPYFTPDVAGTYTATDSNTGAAIKVYAGTWRGIMTGPAGGATNTYFSSYDTTCTGCHSTTDSPNYVWSGSTSEAPDKFKPWSVTGHSKRFSQGINDSGITEVYNNTCFNCHTLGWVNPTIMTTNNGGFADQPNYSQFVTAIGTYATSTVEDSTRYATLWSSGSYTLLLKKSNIQCEHCHGPQDSTGAHEGDNGGAVVGVRNSLDANVCGECHGAATHHTRYNTWKISATGHANYDLARNEGTLEKNASAASCAACHTAQGNIIYQKQLVSGNPLRTIPTGSITWTVNTVQPQTCAVCHDPHNVGSESDDAYFTPEQVTNNGQPRLALMMSAASIQAIHPNFRPGTRPRASARAGSASSATTPGTAVRARRSISTRTTTRSSAG